MNPLCRWLEKVSQANIVWNNVGWVSMKGINPALSSNSRPLWVSYHAHTSRQIGLDSMKALTYKV